MKPYYEDSHSILYHGSCEEHIEDLEFNLAIIDPPYGMEFRSNYRKEKHMAIHGDDAMPSELIKRIIDRATHAAYVFHRWDNLWELPCEPTSLLAWVKNNWSMGDLKHEHGRQWEACSFYPKSSHEFLKRIPDVLIFDRTGNGLHPTQKPLAMIRTLVSANVGDIVFDGFCGSGTTLLAAKLCDRKAIGFEVEEKYCETIARRLSETEASDGMFRNQKDEILLF